MFASQREDWDRLKSGSPGRRFEDLYEARHARKGRSTAVRAITLVAGVVLTLVGPIVGLIPGPGGIVVFAVGVGLLACELRPAARALDWCEPRLRAGWKRVKRTWKRASRISRTAVSLLGVLLIGACGYLVFAWMSSSS